MCFHARVQARIAFSRMQYFFFICGVKKPQIILSLCRFVLIYFVLLVRPFSLHHWFALLFMYYYIGVDTSLSIDFSIFSSLYPYLLNQVLTNYLSMSKLMRSAPTCRLRWESFGYFCEWSLVVGRFVFKCQSIYLGRTSRAISKWTSMCTSNRELKTCNAPLHAMSQCMSRESAWMV